MGNAEVTILGAGPAALAATAELISHRIPVTIIDENQLPGGQYFRQIPKSFRITERTVFDKASSDYSRSTFLFQTLNHPLVTYMPNTVIWGYFSDYKLGYVSADASGEISAKFIIVASGAFDRPVPFPGWTLPGVISAGGAQNLMLGQRVVPGHRILISGNGPLNIAVAYNLVRAGGNVLSILEVSKQQIWRAFPGMLWDPLVLFKGLQYQSGLLLRAGVLARTGRTVIEARGDKQVSEVVTARIDSMGNIDRSHTQTYEVDLLVVGYGLMPSIEMTRLMGCEQEYDPSNKYFIPVRSDKFETTVPNIFAVGDCAGIRGVEVALIEGRLAGITIADRLGRVSRTYVKKSRSQLEKRLLRLLRFHTSIDSLFVSPSNYFSLLTDDTVICRCEEVTLGELRSYMNQGITDLNTLKSLTRIGMGRCQGRNCFPTFAHLVAEEQKVSVASLKIPRTRSPLKPVCIGDVIRCELPECDLPEMKQP